MRVDCIFLVNPFFDSILNSSHCALLLDEVDLQRLRGARKHIKSIAQRPLKFTLVTLRPIGAACAGSTIALPSDIACCLSCVRSSPGRACVSISLSALVRRPRSYATNSTSQQHR
mmetsp:Transcript_12085/g.34786  ORF Transcript_12085/g.34786 Transcript_12085/m.34786 type:complete len:115 (+) Transcript_12085:516-860(+)